MRGITAAEQLIHARIEREGRLTFAAFMDEALYGPDGYYTRRARLGGQSADFFTSPELHPAFGSLLGRVAANLWEQLGQPDTFEIVEHGPGTGALCRDLLNWADHALPTFGRVIRYRLVEASPALQSVQRETLNHAGDRDAQVTWGAPDKRSVRGLVLANELVDALPVHIVTICGGRLLERYVTQDADGRLRWQDDTPSTPELADYFERLSVWPGDGCIAEVNLAGVAWMEQAAATLERGAMVVLDYGYTAAELYAHSRKHGTLLTYRAHTLGSDPLRHIGEQDITAHIDFTSLARTGERGGLQTLGIISQAALLRRLGLERYLHQLDQIRIDAANYAANRRALQALVDPEGLGRVQALVQTRGLPDFDPFAESARRTLTSSWTPVLLPDQMRLPGPLEAEGFVDLDGQWRELFGDASDDEEGARRERPGQLTAEGST